MEHINTHAHTLTNSHICNRTHTDIDMHTHTLTYVIAHTHTDIRILISILYMYVGPSLFEPVKDLDGDGEPMNFREIFLRSYAVENLVTSMVFILL